MGFFSDGPRGDSAAIRELVESARRRLKENPDDAGAVLKLADALVASGRKTEAVRLLNRYGPIVQSRGCLEEAIAIYKKASQLDPDCDLTSSTYLSHLQLKKILEAEKAAPPVAPPAPTPPPSGNFTRPGSRPSSPERLLSEAGAGPGSSVQRFLPAPDASREPTAERLVRAARAGRASFGMEPEKRGRPRRKARNPPPPGHPPGPDRPRPPADQPAHARSG